MLPRQQQLGTECTEAMRQEICHCFKKNLAAGRSRVRRQTIAVCVEELACFSVDGGLVRLEGLIVVFAKFTKQVVVASKSRSCQEQLAAVVTEARCSARRSALLLFVIVRHLAQRARHCTRATARYCAQARRRVSKDAHRRITKPIIGPGSSREEAVRQEAEHRQQGRGSLTLQS